MEQSRSSIREQRKRPAVKPTLHSASPHVVSADVANVNTVTQPKCAAMKTWCGLLLQLPEHAVEALNLSRQAA